MDLGMPWRAIAFYGLCMIVFVFSMIQCIYERNVINFMVYVVYAVAGLFSILIGWGMIKAIERQEE